MKKVLLISLTFFIFSSCTPEEVELALSAQAEGHYDVYELDVNGKIYSFPAQTIQSTLDYDIDLSTETEDMITLVITQLLTENGTTKEIKKTVTGISLQKAADGSIELFGSGTKSGQIFNGELNATFSQGNDILIYYARK